MSGRAFDITFILTFFIILIAALCFDVMDFILELIGFPLKKARTATLIATKSISVTLDSINAIVIGAWTYWVNKKRAAGMPAAAEGETQSGSPENEKKSRGGIFSRRRKEGKAAGGIAKKALMPALRTTGLGFVGEVLPIIGMAPFWTLSVLITFINVIREK